MKKISIILILLVSGFIAKSQDDQGLHFGLKITPAIAWLKTDTKGIESNGSKFGFAYGLMTEFRFSDHYSFATGIDVTYRGGNLRSTTTIDEPGIQTVVTTLDSKSTLQYIEIPLTLKLKTNEIGYLTYYLQAGLSPGINLKARADYSSVTETTPAGGTKVTTNSESTDNDIKPDINNFNLSMLIGGGVEYTLSGSTVLLVGIQFNNGLLDIADGTQSKINTNMLGLSIGILF